ncbi:hypothetical protein PQC36_gp057 [Proteus phage Vb_PmiP-P59]|uniref:Uncharacterized protein n=4 Tax=Privateervirus TaxID=2843440 RepID=A0A7L7SSL4_9CAUD|nr:hypothetical protein HWB19_gp112 [Cronobacter phage vB_CsaP_009]YP_009857474.1 hypothetical protein HWD17_gp042 [Proteus phage Privateer]YP_010672184.1 hypothetical protein PQC36_gp057 [Proteus phage Vb_PmiP-P59]YP_010672305.1 hypothetical protein PQC37_gp042 [Proteus phage 3H10_20]QIN94835.1 hypothetical protein CPT_Privateer_042 [Proteus phage Privateer]QMV48227.1 hypothetical protein [Proteus phage Vb_PmiP-P59]QOC54828.1 hypothetical protein [Proteus phage 3H10_20]BBU72758.1 hypothetic
MEIITDGKLYKVVLPKYSQEYLVINKERDFVEHRTSRLSEAVTSFEAFESIVSKMEEDGLFKKD